MTKRTEGELARFAYQRRRGKSDWVRQLLPNKNLEASIARVDCLECSQILELGVTFGKLSATLGPIHGWIEFHEDAVHSHHLTIDYDNKPERHANIQGWPDDTSSQLQICRKLYDACTRRAKFNPPISDVNDADEPCNKVERINMPKTRTQAENKQPPN